MIMYWVGGIVFLWLIWVWADWKYQQARAARRAQENEPTEQSGDAAGENLQGQHG